MKILVSQRRSKYIDSLRSIKSSILRYEILKTKTNPHLILAAFVETKKIFGTINKTFKFTQNCLPSLFSRFSWNKDKYSLIWESRFEICLKRYKISASFIIEKTTVFLGKAWNLFKLLEKRLWRFASAFVVTKQKNDEIDLRRLMKLQMEQKNKTKKSDEIYNFGVFYSFTTSAYLFKAWNLFKLLKQNHHCILSVFIETKISERVWSINYSL